MALKSGIEKNRIPSATGPAGPIPHRHYCAPACYAGNPASTSDCKCKGCKKNAHGRGRQYAFENGYLKNSQPNLRKPPEDQEELFPDESAN
jgi:hypothetical protein